MKYAIFSDIHGNIYALDAMMNSLQNDNIERYLFCGDIAGYYYYADKIVQTFKNLPNLHIVKGNHDALYVGSLTDKSVQQEAIEKYGSAYSNIDAEVAQYIKDLPETISLNIGGYRIVMLHGSPNSPLSGRIYSDTALDTTLPDCDFLFTGHTHYQMMRKHISNCTIINPGSLGQPRDGKGFSFCIADFSTGSVEHRTAKFDLSHLLEEIAEKDPDNAYLVDVLHRNRGERA